MLKPIRITLIATAIALGAIIVPGYAAESGFVEAIANAKTPADHEALAQRYESEAKELAAKAAEHKRMATSYRTMGGRTNVGYVAHCEKLSAAYDAAAREDSELAKLHHQFAAQLQK